MLVTLLALAIRTGRRNKICLPVSSHVWLLLELITANTITPVFQAQRSTLSKHQYLYILLVFLYRHTTPHHTTIHCSGLILSTVYYSDFSVCFLFSALDSTEFAGVNVVQQRLKADKVIKFARLITIRDLVLCVTSYIWEGIHKPITYHLIFLRHIHYFLERKQLNIFCYKVR